MVMTLSASNRYSSSYDNIKSHKPHLLILKPHPLPLTDSMNYWTHGRQYQTLENRHHGYWTTSNNYVLKFRPTCLNIHNTMYGNTNEHIHTLIICSQMLLCTITFTILQYREMDINFFKLKFNVTHGECNICWALLWYRLNIDFKGSLV